jgi:hypothetical protein
MSSKLRLRFTILGLALLVFCGMCNSDPKSELSDRVKDASPSPVWADAQAARSDGKKTTADSGGLDTAPTKVSDGAAGTAPDQTADAGALHADARINNDGLGDAEYTAATGIVSSGTFVLYPRQIRNYLDQLYNIDTHILPVGQVVLRFDMANLRYVFERVFSSLGIKNPTSGAWRAITAAEANSAFDAALAQAGLTAASALYLSAAAERSKIFDLLEAALTGLQQILGGDFTATSETNLATGESGPGTSPQACPSNPPIYPTGRGSYTTGTVVQASDQKLYRCQIAGWCNSTADSYYAPATGSAWSDAWVALTCAAP